MVLPGGVTRCYPEVDGSGRIKKCTRQHFRQFDLHKNHAPINKEFDPFQETQQRGGPRKRRGHKDCPTSQGADGRRPATTLEGHGKAQGGADQDFDAAEDDAADAAPSPGGRPAQIVLFPNDDPTQP